MRTSLNDIRTIERHLHGEMDMLESEQFDKRISSDASFHQNVSLQKRIMELLQYYHRRKLKLKIAAAQDRIFNDPDYAELQYTVHTIFKS